MCFRKLQDVIFEKGGEDSAIAKAIEELNNSVVDGVNRLRQEFTGSTTIPLDIRLPEGTGDLFRAFAVNTGHGGESMPISVRGDGIRCRFLPSLLNYISESSNLFHIWGFEEPENSLEHAMSTKLALRMRDEYSKSAQILATSHSPAFFTLSGPRVSVFRIYRDAKNNGTVTGDDGVSSTSLVGTLAARAWTAGISKGVPGKVSATCHGTGRRKGATRVVKFGNQGRHEPNRSD